VNKTAASAAQPAKCNPPHTHQRTTASSQPRENKQKPHIAYQQTGPTESPAINQEQLRLKIPKKQRTANPYPELTGSYKKKRVFV